MGKRKSQFRIRTRTYIPLIFILATILITYVFPRQGKFKYSFSEGRPWRYGLLTAPFDFPIFKSDQQLKQDRDSILVFYEPYYKIDKDVEVEAIANFDADSNLDPTVGKLERSYVGYIRSKLLDIYKTGIINSAEYDKVEATKRKTVRLREGKEAKTKDIATFYTIKSAYEDIIESAPASMDRNKLKEADINDYLKDNIIYDQVTSEKARNEFVQQVSPTLGMVQAGERIIGEGEIVDHNVYNILSSLKRVTEERTGTTGKSGWILIGEFFLIAMMMGSFYMYLLFFRPTEYRNRKHVVFMLLNIVFFIVLTAINVNFNLFNVYIIPYAILTILIRTFIDSRTALFASIITILICSLMVTFAFEFLILQMTIAMICIFNLKELTERSQLIRSSFIILGSYIVMYVALVLTQEGDITKINWEILLYFLINFIFITFSYLLVYMVEKSFGFISGVTMIELANINRPLLRQLSEEAPGTFQHSMQVSNLAAAAALKIGANPSLVRTGALYHDIGKMDNPAFFTENQSPGMNPHLGLPFEESARIIIDHVRLGVRRGHKAGLPQQIIDFIQTHHGTSTPKYFYNSWRNANPGKEIDNAAFSYPGPNPFSKETAILMMADTVEAASRSLPEYTEEAIRNLVDKLIDSQMQEGLFQKAPITFKEVDDIKELFTEKLKTIYHSRIAYPDLKSTEEPLKTNKTLNEI